MASGGGRAKLLELLQGQISTESTFNAQPSLPSRPGGRGGRGMMIMQSLDANIKQPVPPKLEELSTGLREIRQPRQPMEKTLASRMAQFAISMKEDSDSSPKCVLEKEVLQSSEDDGSSRPIIRRGEYGQVVRGTCNYIKLDIEPGKGVFEYEVRFEPRIDYLKYRRALLYQQEDKIGRAKTFDGVTLYLPHKLDAKVILHSKHPVDNSVVQVTIIFRRYGKMKDCIHLYNVLFKRIMSALDMTRIGKHYFLSQMLAPIPKYNLEVWPGYVTAVDEYEGGIQLCLDNSHRVLRTITVLETMNQIVMTNANNYKQLVLNSVIGQTVLTRYNNKTYRVDDINWNMSPMSCFTGKQEKQVTFMDYYKMQYGIVIKDPKQPMLVCRMKRLQGEQETEVEICLVPELSYMTGLTDRMRSDCMLMKSVAVYTRITPEQRQKSIMKFVQSVNETPKARELLRDWGLTLRDETVELETRQLPVEEIFVAGGELGNRRPDFAMDITKKKMYGPRPLENWFLLYTEKDTGHAKAFVDTAKRVGPPMGIQVCDPRLNPLPNDRIDTYVNALRNMQRSSQVQLVVIIFPSSRDDRYAAVKKVACCDLGIPSQVINSRTLSRQDKVRSIVQKIILQITCKLGGSLWTLKIPMTNAMICGTDVYHDPVRKGKSVGAFISSLNRSCTRWYCQTNCMEVGQELINQFVVSMKNALVKFHKVNGTFPNRIFIYRDGISDGQLKVSQELEIPQFQACFDRVSEGYNPTLTVFIVQKRINTRIFTYQRDKELINPPPGTVVDSMVTRRNWADFFLVSQSVREGTVTPTHYIILHDSSEMKVDLLQRLTYKLCFMYYNWPGGIRVPAPCQYAHKLAYLSGQHLHEPHAAELSEKLFFL